MTDATADQPGAGALAAYEAMAPWYDRFTADHDFETWVSYLEPLLEGHGLEGTRLLDVACGTGKSFEAFARRGYDVTGVDLSPAMLAEAARRAPGAALHAADMRDLERLGSFDLALCLGDALNYVDGQGLRRTFAGVAVNLAPGGFLLCDLNSLKTYRDTFGADRCIDADDGFIAWCGRTPGGTEPGGLAETEIVAFVPGPGGGWARTTTRHRQQHHPQPSVRAALTTAGFDQVTAYGMRPDGEPDGPFDEWQHHKALVVARRAGAPPTSEGR